MSTALTMTATSTLRATLKQLSGHPTTSSIVTVARLQAFQFTNWGLVTVTKWNCHSFRASPRVLASPMFPSSHISQSSVNDGIPTKIIDRYSSQKPQQKTNRNEFVFLKIIYYKPVELNRNETLFQESNLNVYSNHQKIVGIRKLITW